MWPWHEDGRTDRLTGEIGDSESKLPRLWAAGFDEGARAFGGHGTVLSARGPGVSRTHVQKTNNKTAVLAR